MSHTWKLLPLAGLFALGVMLLMPNGGGIGNTPVAEAAHSNQVRVEVDSFPAGGTGYEFRITQPGGANCRSDWHNETFTLNDGQISSAIDCVNSPFVLTITSITPAHSELTDIFCSGATESDVTVSVANERVELSLVDEEHIICTFEYDYTATTPTATATGTVGPAATVIASASPNTVGCNGTAIVTVQVRTAAGNPVATGTAVNITASLGSVSPTSGQTTAADGSVFVFYSAPANQGGQATINATAGSAQGSTTIQVNCNIATATPVPPTATTPPPPTVAPISPPATGDAGLAEGAAWRTYAGIALILASVLGATAVVRRRA